MYIVQVPVPFALLLAAGKMPVVSIKWRLKVKVLPRRVLIYAKGLKKPLSSYPVEWQMIANNAEVFGNIPHYVDQAINAIVGWVDISQHGVIPKVWNYGEDLYHAFNAHTLDKPFYCNIKHEGFDLRFSLDDYALVAHRKKTNHIYAIGNTLYVPVNARIFAQSAYGTIITIDLIGEATKWLITEDNDLREYDSVVIYHNDMYREFEFSSRNYIMPRVDADGKLLMYHSVLRGGENVGRTGVVLFLKDELDS